MFAISCGKKIETATILADTQRRIEAATLGRRRHFLARAAWKKPYAIMITEAASKYGRTARYVRIRDGNGGRRDVRGARERGSEGSGQDRPHVVHGTRLTARVLRKETGKAVPKIVRFVVGNPLIMKEMAKHVPDAGSYAPVTVLIDERADGVHLSYDGTASFLARYRNSEALAVARDLDSKIEALLREPAAWRKRFGRCAKGAPTMPMIDVYAIAGTLSDKHSLAQDLAKAVMKWENVPPINLFKKNTAAFILDLPSRAISNAAGDSNYVHVQVLTPVNVLGREK
jgi:hypothetical protein